MSTDIQQLLDRYAGELHTSEVALNTAYWDMETTGTDEAKERVVANEVRANAIFQRRDDWATIKRFHASRSEIGDADTRRQVELLYLEFAANQDDPERFEKRAQLGADIGADFTSFRATVGGSEISDNEVNGILRDSTDSGAVEEAWKAGKAIGPLVADRVVRIAEMRNELARDQGYADFYAQQLALQEIKVEDLFRLLDSLETLTREPFARTKSDLDARLASRFGIPQDKLRPWHYANPFFQEPPPLTTVSLDPLFTNTDVVDLSITAFDRIGLDTRDILDRSDLYEKSGKNQHAFCIDVDRMNADVRVLCNVRADQYWMATMLHELGHAVYDKYLAHDLPFLLKQAAHTNSTEAIAMLMGRLTHTSGWLTAIAGASPAEAEALSAAASRDQAFTMLTFVRWVLVMTHFERALYENPTRPDLNGLWWALVSRFQMLTVPEGRLEGTHADWAAKIHLALYPVYYHNYMIGELTASQIQDRLTAEYGDRWFLDPRSGGKLRDGLFALGARYPWDETVTRVTGQPLSAAHFANQFVSA